MKLIKALSILSVLLMFSGCSDDDTNTTNNGGQSNPSGTNNTDNPSTIIAAGTHLKVTSFINQQYSGNIESVRPVEGRDLPSAVAVSSKSKTLHYLENNGTKLENYYLDYTGNADAADDEYTNSAVFDADHTLITHTILVRDGSDKLSDCRGELLIVNHNKTNNGGDSSATKIEVGSMPDSVAITPDKKYAITADEHDSEEAWGKCTIGTIDPTISIIQLTDDSNQLLAEPQLVKRIKFSRGKLGPREPEYIAVASDSDTVAVTLQDSHEVAVFSLKSVLAQTDDILPETAVTITELAKSDAGTNAWPDGIIAFDVNNAHYFAIAGESNDTITIVNAEGAAVSNPRITEREVPTSYPCLEADWFPNVKYSPDSITSFEIAGRVYVAATLRYAGAVIVYDVTNPAAPAFEFVMHAGQNDIVGNGVCSEEDTSIVYPEGISSGKFGDAVYLWVANEGDNSVSSIKIEAK